MRSCPSDIEVMIHCHCVAGAHPRLHATAVKQAIDKFLRLGLIEPGEIPNTYLSTEKGEFWMGMICETPLPELRLVDPRKKQANGEL